MLSRNYALLPLLKKCRPETQDRERSKGRIISTKIGNSVGMYFNSGGCVAVAAFFLELRDRRGDGGDGLESSPGRRSGAAKCPVDLLFAGLSKDEGRDGGDGSCLSR